MYIKKKSQLVAYQLDETQRTQVKVTKGDYVSIEADKPVFVLQYVVTQITQGNCAASECGSSYVLMVPPMQQRKHQYLFSTANALGKHNVNLVIATPLRNGVLIKGTDLLSYINSSNINPTPIWNVVDNNSNKNGYLAIQFLVNEGLHNISHNSSNALFTVTSVPHSTI